MPKLDKNYKSDVLVPKNRHTFNYQVAKQKTVARYWLAFCLGVAFFGMIIVGIM